ncbi:MAG TPA: DNA repair protein RecN [Rudaea sp.]|jgi:DNA repair protein RecN (Recombination protein N)|uniref:DNA repair protein RecN n=1 Tax=Rudaea sp. TaxID=2136325 RepID=UPI002F95F949
MLQTLFVKDFAIVGEAEIGFAAGLTVVTGETGAGKSLLVDALLLLAGNRADASVVRHGSERAELIAEFALADAPAARAWLANEEFDEGDACQLRRVIRAEGSSRAWINGRPATLTQMQALAGTLIEIHGQHEHQALLERASQLALLDAYGGHAEALASVAVLAERWREIAAKMRALSAGEDHSARIDLLEHHLDELDRHALAPAELATLNETHQRLANAGQLIQGSAAIAELLDGEGEFALLRLAGRAQNELARLQQTDARLAPARELLDAASIQLGETSDLIARYRDSLDLDPERLAEAEAQIAKLHELSRKHRVPTAELKAHADSLRTELETMRGAGEQLVLLERERGKIERDYAGAAQILSGARTATAQKLGTDVSALLDELGMAGGRFEAQLEKAEKSTPDAQGLERVEFLVSANPGQPTRALRKVASGGELSRISLAIEVAALGLDEIGTMVFDEVDAGIGGAVAEVVGQKLRRLGSRRQVLCVTHLAQVAAQGHQHLQVAKSSDGKSTQTQIELLDAKTRRGEIARMLGGVEITRETLAHAKQMLENGRRETGDGRRD